MFFNGAIWRDRSIDHPLMTQRTRAQLRLPRSAGSQVIGGIFNLPLGHDADLPCDAECRPRTESVLRPTRACNRDESKAAVDEVNTPVLSQHHHESLNVWRFRDDSGIFRQTWRHSGSG